ncbi:MAG: SPARC- modular calcium-binding protein 2 [Pleopsidium flavum]|nr:MAG: SPARC- modular calcium-binding protein 2 [Pleopsidium flavum]
MSRRIPNPAADRAAQNQQTIKSLLKLEGNKSCADSYVALRRRSFKRNGSKHKDANILGLAQIRDGQAGTWEYLFAYGIHRGMGTHISRVKSVDLDAWTDEQLQSVLRWGNSRANKSVTASYKLKGRYAHDFEGIGRQSWRLAMFPLKRMYHCPLMWEAALLNVDRKLENFIRTKYESKRWVMDGGMPDPATLDTEADDDVPLNIVQEKAKLERASSQRVSSTSSQPSLPPRRPAQNIDLFDDSPPPPPARPSTTDTPTARAPPLPSRAPAAPPKQTKPGDSLLGLDFFGGSQSAPPGRPSSASSNPVGSTGPSRPDLKQSILSLYASAPRPQPQPQPQHSRQDSFGGMQTPLSQQQPQQTTTNGMHDAFSSLSFASSTSPPPSHSQFGSQQQPKPSPFANLSNFTSQRSTPAAPKVTTPPYISGGGFFDPAPKPLRQSIPPVQQAQRTLSSSSGFGDFSAAPSVAPITTRTTTNSGMNDLFDFSESSPAPVPTKGTSPPTHVNSAFNLSAPAPPSQPAPTIVSKPQSSTAGLSAFSNADPWGSNDAWATPEPAPAGPKASAIKPPRTASAATTDFGWASTNNGSGSGGFGATSAPKISADEDFGGWSSAAPITPAANPSTQATKPASGFGGSDDLFSNVWE